MAKKNELTANLFVLADLAFVGFLFARSSWGKISGGVFVSHLGGTLQAFAAKNPYPWFKAFLETVAIPNAELFGLLTMWGEFFAGVSILVSIVCLLFVKGNRKMFTYLLGTGLFVGAFLSGIFYLAAGWMSPSTEGLNLLMFLVQAAGLVYVFKLSKSS